MSCYLGNAMLVPEGTQDVRVSQITLLLSSNLLITNEDFPLTLPAAPCC